MLGSLPSQRGTRNIFKCAEAIKGSITTGKLRDFVVLSDELAKPMGTGTCLGVASRYSQGDKKRSRETVRGPGLTFISERRV
jgi:hypothetical protein